MSAVAPLLTRTNRRFGASFVAPNPAPPQARRWSTSLSWSQVRQLAPGTAAPVATPGITLSANPTSYTTNFAGAIVLRGLDAAPTSYATTFNAAAVKRGRTLKAAVTTFSFTGNAATLVAGNVLRLSAAPTSFATTFNPSSLVFGNVTVLGANPTSFATTVNAASIKRGRTLRAAPTTFSFSVNDASLARGPLSPNPDVFVVPPGRRLGKVRVK